MIPLIALLPVLLVGSALASGSETALFSLTHGDRARLRREAPAAAAAIDAMLSQPRALLIFVLLLNMSINVSYFVVTSVLATQIGSGALGAAVGVGSVLGIILFGEVLAKTTARAQRMAFCRVLGVPMRGLQIALSPVLTVLDRLLVAPLARLVGGGLERPLGAAEVAALVRTGGDVVRLSDDDRRVLEEVVAFGARRVRDVMKPRVRLGWVPDDAGVEEVRTAAHASGRTVLVVRRGGGEGPVVGLAHVKPFLAAAELAEGRGPPRLSRYCDDAVFVPETARLDVALGQLRRRSAGMLLCVDEHGDVSGWLEPEDIADELLRGLGEDDPEAGAHLRLVGLGRWWVPGSVRLHEIERQFGFEVGAVGGDDSARSTTVGGLLAEGLGRLPIEGDAIDFGPVRLVAVEVSGRRVDAVELELRDDAGHPGEGGPA
ncbi:MAG: CNNM domain-containing protein [Planctomycetota bacterium]